MEASTLWWLLAGTAIAVELLTGTFYLLMMALGLSAAALGAHAGASVQLQLLAAALVGGGSVLAWWAYRVRHRDVGAGEASAVQHLDIGEIVTVSHWHADGSAMVRHRGAQWQVTTAPGVQPRAGAHRIVELQGNRLVLEPV